MLYGTHQACSALISFPLLTFRFLFFLSCLPEGWAAFSLPTTVSSWASLVPKWQLCALCPSNWNCHSHLPFPPQALQNDLRQAGSPALHRKLAQAAWCSPPGPAEAMDNDLPNCELQHYRFLHKTNKQKHQQQTFGMNHECTGLDVFEMEASKVPFGDQRWGHKTGRGGGGAQCSVPGGLEKSLEMKWPLERGG